MRGGIHGCNFAKTKQICSNKTNTTTVISIPTITLRSFISETIAAVVVVAFIVFIVLRLGKWVNGLLNANNAVPADGRSLFLFLKVPHKA